MIHSSSGSGMIRRSQQNRTTNNQRTVLGCEFHDWTGRRVFGWKQRGAVILEDYHLSTNIFYWTHPWWSKSVSQSVSQSRTMLHASAFILCAEIYSWQILQSIVGFLSNYKPFKAIIDKSDQLKKVSRFYDYFIVASQTDLLHSTRLIEPPARVVVTR